MFGAAYLTYLGLRMLFQRTDETKPMLEFHRESHWAIYRAGFLTNLLNPKVALFFVAFLFLGSLFIFTGTIWCLVLAWFGSVMSRRIRAHRSAGSWLARATGALFVGLGVRLAVSR